MRRMRRRSGFADPAKRGGGIGRTMVKDSPPFRPRQVRESKGAELGARISFAAARGRLDAELDERLQRAGALRGVKLEKAVATAGLG